MKKIIAIVLSAVMLMSVLSVGISAGTTVTPYEVGARNTIVKFVDASVKKIAPVEIQVVKLPAKFDGKIAVCYADDKVLESFNKMQFTAKYNTVYDVKATSETSYGSGKVIYMNTAEDETLGYNKVVFIKAPKGYVVYPDQKPVIIDDTASWQVTYEVITDEAYAAILAAEKAAAEKAAAEAAEKAKEALAPAVAEEDAETAEAVVVIDLEALIAVVKEVLGEDFDLDAILATFADEEGIITADDFFSVYALLIADETLDEATVAALMAAVEEFVGAEIAAMITELIDMVIAALAEQIAAEVVPAEVPGEA